MNGIRLVTLDMVGTVIKFSSPPVSQYKIVAAKHGVQVDIEPLAASFKYEWQRMNREFPHFGSTTEGMSSIVWWHQLVKVAFTIQQNTMTLFHIPCFRTLLKEHLKINMTTKL